MQTDEEGFRYPLVDQEQCIHCDMCRQVCPHEHVPQKHGKKPYVFGGYHLNENIRFESTSGGAFSAIVDAFCDENYVVFGAQAEGLSVLHRYITAKKEVCKFRKSKYSQSVIGDSYKQVKTFLLDGKKVLFSGTPCQIAGLINFLGNTKRDNLLTIEVICEGVPSPLYIQKLNETIEKKYSTAIESIDYRYTGKNRFSHGKWDFQVMQIVLKDKKILVKDRWFNPFWSIWLQHLMSRPSCYHCKFTTTDRVADITLGDLWGVHLYCPDLYGKNGGASLILCNTEKGKQVFQKAKGCMFGRELIFEDALKYQSPLKRTISENPNRFAFMMDLRSDISYENINQKWAKRPSLKLLFSKYVIGKCPWIWWSKLRNKFKGENHA